jgi:hypothetical protein
MEDRRRERSGRGRGRGGRQIRGGIDDCFVRPNARAEGKSRDRGEEVEWW